LILLNEKQSAAAPAARAELMRELFARAVGLHKEGKPRDAEAVLVELLQRFPNHFGALNMLGVLALRSGRYRRAAVALSRAAALNPASAPVYNNLGEALRHLKRPRQAIVNYDKAISLHPKDVAGYNNKAIALVDLGRYEEAIQNCDTALALNPNSVRALVNRGNALRNLDRMQEALECYDTAIAIEPNFEKAHLNRGATLHDLDRLEEAVAACDRAIALAPNHADAHFNRGNSLRELNRLDEAIASYDTAIKLRPNYAQPRWNQGNCLLLKGDFEKGLPQYEFRVKRAAAAKRMKYAQPIWKGDAPIAGKTLFIYRELFLGDMIQFCRYARLAEEHGARVVLAAQPSLHRLLATLSPTIEIISDDKDPAHFDYHCPLMSLPLAFKTRLETIYAPAPYLSVEPERVEKWKRKIGDDGIKVGICWQGSTTAYAVKLQRSFPLEMFRQLAQMPGVRLISLQKSDGTDQLSHLPGGMKVETLGEEFDAGPDAFLDSAAAMRALDLVITTDTALAHLAGALACPVWTVLKHVPDWRWLLERSDSPWYPSMRLFRQRERGDWQSAFDEIAAAYVQQFRGRG
jgi:tetratricopeptide (TPR) repeat protein